MKCAPAQLLKLRHEIRALNGLGDKKVNDEKKKFVGG